MSKFNFIYIFINLNFHRYDQARRSKHAVVLYGVTGLRCNVIVSEIKLEMET